MSTPRIPLLVLNTLSPQHQAQIAAVYDLHYAPMPNDRTQAITARGGMFRAVLTIGSIGLTAQEIEAMPSLELICAMGAGYENIALDAARARGIAVANGAGTNDDCVADHAFGLLISIVRGLRPLDRLCREGVWRDAIGLPPNVSGKRLGIFGLGTIGQKIARRAAGFDMEIGYHNRRPRGSVPHRYFDSLRELAEWSDILVCATPGGPETRHAVNAEVLDAIGPLGYLVNIARGSVVDTEELAAALRDRRIAGAGLDVYESEPHPPEALVGLENVVLTPHVAGWSPEAVQSSVDRFLANAEGHFSGRGVVSPV
ncbi:2-hydroxyacid dehydrogenase [Paracidovorax anthurii]|uniref:Lactate dehydrogenase-like 2-hydroxyacid dehydrogenase n=1 Tax=Paracidovorax anthurii TaxID=78229 RepID=A0A328ZHK6_9BURK|nr:2-hydroxyacid dehydrogenase [Paracidovorax anthurii]RAR84805.1 lactate dehydrogenase-like 2-hydroxyacid dehydrogenase [Paracidovorax anthurii]